MAHGWAPLFAKIIGRQWRHRPKEQDDDADEVNEHRRRSVRHLANRSGFCERRVCRRSSNESMYTFCVALVGTEATLHEPLAFACLWTVFMCFLTDGHGSFIQSLVSGSSEGCKVEDASLVHTEFCLEGYIGLINYVLKKWIRFLFFVRY
jgi:hypothetical protein